MLIKGGGMPRIKNLVHGLDKLDNINAETQYKKGQADAVPYFP